MRFSGVDTILAREPKSTGEVMGARRRSTLAFAKAQLGSGSESAVGVHGAQSVNTDDKPNVLAVAEDLAGTAPHGLDVVDIRSLQEYHAAIATGKA